jgi:hypothetical protein
MSTRILIPFIAQQLNKQLTDAEKRYIADKAKNVTLTRHNFAPFVAQIIKNIKRENFNIRQHLLEEIKEGDNEPIQEDELINTKMALNRESPFKMSKEINPFSKYYYNYMVIDTANMDPSQSTTTSFYFSINEGPPDLRQGVINLSEKLNPFVAMRISRVSVNYVDEDTFSNIFNAPLGRIYFYITNLTQYAIGPSGQNFHFLLNSSELDRRGNSFTLSPFRSNRGWFRCSEPHRNPDYLRIELGQFADITKKVAIRSEKTSITGTQTYGTTRMNAAADPAELLNELVIDGTARDMLPIVFNTFGNTNPYDSSYLDGPVDGKFDFSGFTIDSFDPSDPADAVFVNSYNTEHAISLWGIENGDDSKYFVPPNVFGALPINPARIPASQEVTLTFQFFPRLVTTLEFICERDEEITLENDKY